MTLYVVNARTGKEPDPAMLRVLCSGDTSTGLERAGLDIRPHFEARRSHPVTWRIVHGAFAAPMYRPTRRERLASWLRRRLPLLRGLAAGAVVTLVLMAYCLLGYLVICGLMDLGGALADWISGVWR